VGEFIPWSKLTGGGNFMITSPEAFIQLRLSEDPKLYQRAASEEASVSVWLALLANHPEADPKCWTGGS